MLMMNKDSKKKMPPFCQRCFPSSNGRDIESEFQRVKGMGKMFWIGYMVCDPKYFRKRSNIYDLHVDEISRMNFDNLPVMYNHKKHRKPLGRVVLAWHDHDFPQSLFAIAFLATITNKAILETPAAIALFGDTCPSLSTLKQDRKTTVEVSVTYCGARNGCVGMFVNEERVREKCQAYGLFSSDKEEVYKHIKEELCASFLDMAETRKSSSVEDILVNLPTEQFEVIKSHMQTNRQALESVSERAETLTDAVGLLSDFMASMINTRLALEKDSDSELAQKRRSDFEVMKERGIFNGKSSDTEAIHEMLGYCRECFNPNPDDNRLVAKVCDIFEKRFPQLTDKLPGEGKSDSLMGTIDAAFDILDEEMKRKEMQTILKRDDQAREKARVLEVARRNFDSLQNTPHKKTISSCHKTANTDSMSLDAFLQKCGIAGSPQKTQQQQSSSSSSSSSKKRKRTGPEEENLEREEEEEDEKDDNHLLEFMYKRETERKEAEARYKQYKMEYTQQKIAKQNERQLQLDAVVSSFPKISKFIESFPDLTVLQDLAKSMPQMIQLMEHAGDGKGKQTTTPQPPPPPPPQEQQAEQLQEQNQMMTDNTMTVDASLPLTKRKETEKNVIFDM